MSSLFKKNTIVSSLCLLMLNNCVYSDNSYSCGEVFVKFKQMSNNTYKIRSASDRLPDDAKDVLQIKFNNGKPEKLISPLLGYPDVKCNIDMSHPWSLSEQQQRLCGEFTNFSYRGIQIDGDANIARAEDTDYKTNPIVKPYLTRCYDEYLEDIKAQKINQEKQAKTNKQFRKNIVQGTETNCGTVVEVKGKMALVQTGGDAGAVWFNKEYLAPIYSIDNNIISCRDNNRIYKDSYGWVLIHR